MSNIKTAAFRLINFEFPDVIMRGNLRPTVETLSVNFSANGFYDEKECVFDLNFSTNVFGEESSPYITVSCKARYKFDGAILLTDIPEYFYANSIAILFPYVRAYISLLTTQANQKAVILPTYNLSSLASELKKNTIVSANAEH